ncbi:MAG: LLM class flavin-dependent oxidoreductase [Candidatus Binataceae bacterium]
MKLSIIDQSPVPEGFTPADALRNTIDLARHADLLGYSRYWIAEHHAIAALASPAPEILIARVAAETFGIRVGSGGILLPHYSPLKVAEIFRMLHALYPNRIDLGIGRAPGGSPLDSFALQRHRTQSQPADDFPNQMAELQAFLNHDFPPQHPFGQIQVTPAMPGGPEIWLLGSSMWSASAAAQLSLPYAFAHFIDPQPTRAALEHYKANFAAAGNGVTPQAILALGAICADSDAQAKRLMASPILFRRRIRQGDLRPIPTPREAIQELGSIPGQMPRGASEWPRYIVGTPEHVRSEFSDIASVLGVDELMIVTVVHDHQARVRSYELIAEAFNLAPRALPL